MNITFSGLFNKSSDMEKVFSELEETLSDIVRMEVEAPGMDLAESMEEFSNALEQVEAGASSEPGPEPGAEDEQPRLTAYTQSRLAALSAFEELHRGVNDDLRLLAETITKVIAAHHSTREFLSTIHSSIHRANDQELANAGLVQENRKLFLQAEQVKKLRSQHESMVETFRRREAKLEQELDSLRTTLATVRLEAVDARRSVSSLETERADLLNDLATKSASAERLTRENEILREKHINLSLDLENAQRRHTETERKYDELTAIHNAEASKLAELRAAVSGSEKEIYRLQKQYDAAEAKYAEAQETASTLEADMDEAAKRSAADIQQLKSDNSALRARLDVAAKAQANATEEIAGFKHALADAASDKKVAEDRLAALKREMEAEKKALAADAARSDAHMRELDELRREVQSLRSTVKRVAPYEGMYKAMTSKSVASDKKSGKTSGAASPKNPAKGDAASDSRSNGQRRGAAAKKGEADEVALQ